MISEHFKGRRSVDISEDIERIFFDISNEDIKVITVTICSITSTALTQ